MKLLVGLGNIGKEYNDTRHNVGFMIIDKIFNLNSNNNWTDKFNSKICKTEIDNLSILLLKPSTYMNLSGKAVISAMQFYKIQKENLIVFHDDLDLDLAKIKVKIGGGDGGHNGIKSIDQAIGNNYIRVRFGIDRPLHKNDVSNYVLSKFTNDEMRITEENINKLLTAIPSLIRNGINGFNYQWSKIMNIK